MRAALVVWFGMLGAGCGMTETETETGSSCTTHEECGGGQFCINFKCVTPHCTSDADCPQGQRCMVSGQCELVSSGQCSKDTDCAVQGKVCHKETGECWGVQCGSEGQGRPCFVGCHEGTQVCQKGSWSTCDAPAYTPVETCDDGIDNNCDGQVDEGCTCAEGATAPCSTVCGQGQKTCTGGAWGECVGPEECCTPGQTAEVDCGNCGKQQKTCGQEGVWDPAGPCAGEGLCAAGTSEELPCGSQCGKQIRICNPDCTWSEWGECTGSGMCAPGDKEQMECGNCGIQEKECGQDCTWQAWGECVEGAGCTSGQQESKPCGLCGQTVRECTSDCQWGEWSQCAGEGECEPGQKATEPCGECGQKEKTCTPDCTWSAFGQCDGAGACSPGDSESQSCGPTSTKGICKKGTQQRTCNSSCQWNSWGDCLGAVWPSTDICGDGIDQDCNGADKDAPDQYEPNDSCAACSWISGDDPEVTLYPTLDSPQGGVEKDDYFCFSGNDGFNLPFTSEHIIVELKNQPLGVDGDLFLYKGASDCGAGKALKSSITIGGANEKIDWEETSSDDTAVYYVRVQNWSDKGNCTQPYTLYIKGLK
jgi:hypothetical protein